MLGLSSSCDLEAGFSEDHKHWHERVFCTSFLCPSTTDPGAGQFFVAKVGGESGVEVPCCALRDV